MVTGEGMRAVVHDKDALMNWKVEEEICISIIFCGCNHLRMLDIQHASLTLTDFYEADPNDEPISSVLLSILTRTRVHRHMRTLKNLKL